MKAIQNQKILIVLLAVSASTLQTANQLPANFKGCISAGGGKCGGCYRRKLLPNNAGCGPLVPDSDHCEAYIRNYKGKVVCQSCEKGYALISVPIPLSNKVEIKCTPGSIFYCLDENIPNSGDQHKCYRCAEGLYSVSQTSFADVCIKIPNAVPHCLEGGEATTSPPYCAVCEEGYAVSVEGRQCVPTPQKGCWFATPQGCVACNPFAGYSMGPDGKCYL